MKTRPKCRSKKHTFVGGCGDPRCPEGLYIKAALDKAIASEDFNAYFTIQEQQRLEPTMLTTDSGWGSLWVVDPVTNKTAKTHVPLTRPDLRKQVENVDKTNIPSFKNFQEFNDWVDNTYPTGVFYRPVYYKNEQDLGVDLISVSQITIDADLRGLGVSNHLKNVLCKYADDHGVILSGTPTNTGDGKMERTDANDKEWRDKALQHRNRLEKSYQKFGYIKNVCFQSYGSPLDYLTGENLEYSWEEQEEFNDEAKRFLSNHGIWVRFPNNTIPEQLLNK